MCGTLAAESGLEASRGGRAGYATAIGLVGPAKSADRARDLCRVSAGTGILFENDAALDSLLIHCYSLFHGRRGVEKSSKHAGICSILDLAFSKFAVLFAVSSEFAGSNKTRGRGRPNPR